MTKMHPNELEIDLSVVQRLVAKQFPQWAGLALEPVPSAGTDNALYLLGKDMVVRLPRIEWAANHVDKEFRWLPLLAPFLPVAIPAPLGKGVPCDDYPWNWSVYRWLKGEHPTVGQIADPELLARELAIFVNAFHNIDLPGGPPASRGVPLSQQDTEVRSALEKLEGMIETRAAASIWDRALKIPKWSKPPVWVHGDLSPWNILTQHGHLSAVIDFGNLGIGDPACDLIIAWNLLPDHARKIFRSVLNVDEATWERGKGWALSIALIALPYYKDTNPTLAGSARHVIGRIMQEDHSCSVFHFMPAQSAQRELIHRWLKQKHLQEWIHGAGLQNTLKGLEQFFQGASSTTYWIGYHENNPFAFLITSPEGENTTTLDAFICDVNYLGKGLAVPMIKQFLTTHFTHVERVLIDPEIANTRAVHVYQKAGFKIVGEFIASWHPVPHYLMELLMKDLL